MLGNEKKKVAVYLRVSTKEQEEMYWEDLQWSKIQKYIDVRDNTFELAGEDFIYKDLAVSWADDIDKRPGLTQLFDDLENIEPKPFDTVIVYKIDRFARKLEILLKIVNKLEKKWVWFISTQESLDTDSPFWKAMLWILWVFSELERDVIKERTSSWKEEAFKKWVWVHDKYWYRKDENKRPYVYENEAKIVRDIYEMYTEFNMSIAQIVMKLREAKVVIPWASNEKKSWTKPLFDNFHWHDSTIRKILSDEIYIWKYFYNKTKKTKGEDWKVTQVQLPKDEWIESEKWHTPIITEETFFKAKKRLEKVGDYKNAQENYLLSWLLKCDHCESYRKNGRIQWIWTKSNYSWYYICWWKDKRKYSRTCEVIPLPKNDLETFIVYRIKELLNNPEAIIKLLENNDYSKSLKQRLEKQIWDTIKQISDLKQSIENVNDMFAFSKISRQEYNSRINNIEDLLNTQNLKLLQLKKEFKKQVDITKYIKGFTLLKKLVDSQIEDLFKNEEALKLILNYVIDEIVIFSRPKLPTDNIPGKKKENQYIPYNIEIKFKLPQEFFDEMHKQISLSEKDLKKSKDKKEKNKDDDNDKKWWWSGWNLLNTADKKAKKLDNIKNNNILQISFENLKNAFKLKKEESVNILNNIVNTYNFVSLTKRKIRNNK